MSIYRRYKSAPGGFRNLIELLEAAAPARRQKMINAGLAEDPDYTRRALSYVIDFTDVIRLPSAELSEVVALSSPEIIAYAIQGLVEDEKNRFLKLVRPWTATDITTMMEKTAKLMEITSARLKIVSIARSLERRGILKIKTIPQAA